MVTSTGGLPVVQDLSFSHPVSCFKPVVKRSTIMVESSRVSNIFPVPVTSFCPWCPSREIPTHPNEEFDHCWLRDALVLTATFLGV